MRIAIDARPAVSAGMTGVGIYTLEVLRRLPSVDPGTRYVAWYLHARRALRPWRWSRRSLPPRRGLAERWVPIPARWFERTSMRWELPRIEWFTRFDALWAPNFVPPPTRSRRLAITVHDLAFRLHPETAPGATRRWLERFGRAIGQAAEVIVPSEATRRDLLELYPVDPGRVTVIHHGVDIGRFRRPSEGEVARIRTRYRIEGRYVVFVGGIEPRKNLPALVDAWAAVASDGRPALVIAGASVPWNPEGRAALERAVSGLPAEARRRVVLTGYVGHRDKVALLGGAEALVFPTLYEGFGFPILEAMAVGVPVLTSSLSSIPEVAGEAALYVDPRDRSSIAEGLERVLRDDALRARLVEAGHRRAAAFTWEASARRHAEVLHRAARR